MPIDWSSSGNVDVVEIDAGAEQALHLDPAALIVSDSSDVLGAEPRRAQATIALATCPPGLRISSWKGTLPA